MADVSWCWRVGVAARGTVNIRAPKVARSIPAGALAAPPIACVAIWSHHERALEVGGLGVGGTRFSSLQLTPFSGWLPVWRLLLA